MSNCYFPLRSSVELFGDRRTPAAVTRAKQAAVLYDRLFIEVGLLQVHVLDAGSSTWWTPPEQLSPERLERTRQAIEPGTPMSFGMAMQPARGVPAEEPGVTVSQGRVLLDYAAEFHTGILDELAPFEADWVHEIALGGNDQLGVPALDEQLKTMNREIWRDSDFLSDRNTFERDYIYKSFNRDAVVATDLGASFNVTGLFTPMLGRSGFGPYYAGSEALDLQVPNLGSLPWEAVLEFRDHPASQEAREKLRGFERTAAREGPQDAYSFLKRVAQETMSAYQAAVADLQTNLPQELAQEVAKTAISFIPVVGPILEKGVSASDKVLDALSEQKTWIAALMRLRSRG